MEASDKKKAPEVRYAEGLSAPQVCSSAGEHISLSRLKVFGSSRKAPASAKKPGPPASLGPGGFPQRDAP